MLLQCTKGNAKGMVSNLNYLSLFFGRLPCLRQQKSAVGFQLHSALVSPNDIVETIGSFAPIGPSPLKTFLLIDIPEAVDNKRFPQNSTLVRCNIGELSSKIGHSPSTLKVGEVVPL